MEDREQLERAIRQLDAQRGQLGDAVADTILGVLRERLAGLAAAGPFARAQRKQVTLLVADLAGFTALGEGRDPEELREIVDAYSARLAPVVARYGGTVVRVVGDALIAAFGAQTAREDDPENAVAAALAMVPALAALDDELARSRGLRLEMSVGVHTGPALVGHEPGGPRDQVTIAGDTLDLATRVQDQAPVGAILISHDTYRHVRGAFSVRPQGSLTRAGDGEPLALYAVSGPRPRAFRTTSRGLEGLETRMIGREAELARLQEQFVGAQAGGPARLVTVIGEAGIGKSRLLYEFASWFELRPERVRPFYGRAPLQRRDQPYALVRDLFAFRFAIQDNDPPAGVRAKLEAGVAEVLGPGSQEQAHLLGQLAGFDCSDSPHIAGILRDPEQLRERAWHAVVQFFAAAAQRDRLVLLGLEDLHWADPASLDFLSRLFREARRLPLLVIALARPALYEKQPGWDALLPGQQLRIDLAPLSPYDSRRLVDEILQRASEVPPALRDRVADQAEGNPFYVEELIKMLIEDRVILAEGERWQIAPGRLARLRIPATLTGVVQARLDGLPPSERATLQRAAVVGRTFWASAVAQLAGAAPETIAADLEALCRHELIQETPAAAFAGEREFRFYHTILQEVAYESVLRSTRPGYHAAAAAWLVARSGERAGERAGLIGAHYEQAGEREAAADWYARAARHAHDSSAHATAIDCYRRALALSDGAARLELQSALYGGLGDALLEQGRYAEAAESYEQLARLTAAAGDAAAAARAWLGQAEVHDGQGHHQAALECAQRARALAAGGSPDTLVLVLCRQAQSLYRLGRAPEAGAVAREALERAGALGARAEMALSLNLLGEVAETLGEPDLAGAYRARALDLYLALGNRYRVASLLSGAGDAERRRGRPVAALALYGEALAVARAVGYRALELSLAGELAALEPAGATPSI